MNRELNAEEDNLESDLDDELELMTDYNDEIWFKTEIDKEIKKSYIINKNTQISNSYDGEFEYSPDFEYLIDDDTKNIKSMIINKFYLEIDLVNTDILSKDDFDSLIDKQITIYYYSYLKEIEIYNSSLLSLLVQNMFNNNYSSTNKILIEIDIDSKMNHNCKISDILIHIYNLRYLNSSKPENNKYKLTLYTLCYKLYSTITRNKDFITESHLCYNTIGNLFFRSSIVYPFLILHDKDDIIDLIKNVIIEKRNYFDVIEETIIITPNDFIKYEYNDIELCIMPLSTSINDINDVIDFYKLSIKEKYRLCYSKIFSITFNYSISSPYISSFMHYNILKKVSI